MFVLAGPTVLEVFNTLLKHLRMSVDFELGEGSRRNSCASSSSVRGRESEERIVQNAIIQTIGNDITSCHLVENHVRSSPLPLPHPVVLLLLLLLLRFLWRESSRLPESGGYDVHHG